MRDYRLPKSHRPSRGKPLLKSGGRSAPKKKYHRLRTRSNSQPSFFGRLFQKLMILGLILAVLLGLGYGLFKTILPQLMPLEQNKNIVIVSANKEKNINQIVVAHFRPSDQVISSHIIPAEQPVMVVGGFGEYPLRSVWPLLEMEKKDEAFVRSAFSFAVGEVVDGVVVTSADEVPDTAIELQKVLGTALRQRSFSGVTLRDQLAVYFFATQLPAEKVRLRTLDTWAAWEKTRSELVLQFPEADCPVAVVNTSQQSGLATAVSRVIEHTGYTVVRVTDDPDSRPESRVAFDGASEVCAAKAASLSHLFPTKVKVEADSATTQTYRAKIILELGEDMRDVIPVGSSN